MPNQAVDVASPIRGEDKSRAEAYILLALLLAAPPSVETLETAKGLSGDDGDFGKAITALSAVARTTSRSALEEEYHQLFVGMDMGEVVPYASYYLTGALYTRPLARLRTDMARLGITRSPDVSEPEDHIAALCEMMAGLILGTFADTPASLAEQKAFFQNHLLEWAPRFFADLEGAQAASFYMPVGRLGRELLAIERQGFEIAE